MFQHRIAYILINKGYDPIMALILFFLHFSVTDWLLPKNNYKIFKTVSLVFISFQLFQ